MAIEMNEATVAIRSDITGGIEEVWRHLASPGTWWTGAERIAIAAESRHAIKCSYCAQCREALSPFAMEGDHESCEHLPEALIDAIHRIVNDSGRLTQSWVDGLIEKGLSEAAYVEAISIIVHIRCVDTFHVGMGLPLPGLPEPLPGEPTRKLPQGAEKTFSWVPTLSPETATGDLLKMWRPGGKEIFVAHVQRAMSLVPAESLSFTNFHKVLYVDGKNLNKLTEGRPGLTRPQIELVAGRMSAMNECFY